MSKLTDLQDELRRRFARPSQLLDERMPDGRSVDEAVRQRVPAPMIPLGGQPIGGPAPTPVGSMMGDAPAPVNTPLPNTRAFTRPPEAPPVQLAPQTTKELGAPPPPKQEWFSNQQTGEPHREVYEGFATDPISGTRAYRDALEKWKPPHKRSLKTALKEGVIGAATAIQANPQNPIEAAIGGFGAGAISGAVQPNAITRAYKLNRANQQLTGRMGEARIQAQTDALSTRQNTQQEAQDEREINNALSQYNRLESYDPDDPADAGLKHYFEGRKLSLPKKIKGSNVIANWSNGRLVLTDKTTAESRGATMSGQTVTDAGRTPNAQGLTPNQQAGVNTATANRDATNTRSSNAITAANTRSANSITAANQRAASAQVGANARAAGRTGRGTSVATQRKAAELIGKLDNVRQRIAAADDRLARNPNDSDAKQARETASQYGAQFAGELNALNAGYEAGAGEKGYPYYKKNGSQPTAPSSKNVVTISEQEIRDAGGNDADIADAKRRASRGEIKLVP